MRGSSCRSIPEAASSPSKGDHAPMRLCNAGYDIASPTPVRTRTAMSSGKLPATTGVSAVRTAGTRTPSASTSFGP